MGQKAFSFAGGGGMIRAADFSPCKTWRYTLRRTWKSDRRRLLWVLLNPSTADETRDDPTNRRGMRFAYSWGYGSLVFCNLFAIRTPEPAEMKKAADPVGPRNNGWIIGEAHEADKIVLGWGVYGTHRGRDREVLELLKGFKLYCLGQTKGGQPRHPLYMKKSTPLERFIP